MSATFQIGKNEVPIVNPCEWSWTRHLYLFSFGPYGSTQCLVYGNCLENALEEAAEWLRENAPGMFHEVKSEEDEVDMTYTESGWLASWEWTVNEIDDPIRGMVNMEMEKIDDVY